jgi:dolichol-phosphate mannosyltransferase
MLSIIFPIRDEEKNLPKIIKLFNENNFEFKYEIIFVNDFSQDNSFKVMTNMALENTSIIAVNNLKKGIGGAINIAIKESKGKYCCIMMADLSDDIEDLKRYYKLISNNNLDAVFGSRFLKDSKCIDYPLKKLILNRIFNLFVKIIYLSKYNDFTNAFKIYKKDSLLKTLPLISESFNIFLEMPLKILSRNFKYQIIPISWKNRKHGYTKFKIQELRSKYLFTLIYCFIEKVLLKKK